jgi:hypothetical protein
MLKIFILFSVILFTTPIFADISTIDKDFAAKIRPVTDFIKNNPSTTIAILCVIALLFGWFSSSKHSKLKTLIVLIVAIAIGYFLLL